MCFDLAPGQPPGAQDPRGSVSRLQQNVKLLKEDLEDFKSKLDILEERIKATLDLVRPPATGYSEVNYGSNS